MYPLFEQITDTERMSLYLLRWIFRKVTLNRSNTILSSHEEVTCTVK